VLGLCWDPSSSECNWQQVSGSLYGYGNGSTAIVAPGVMMYTQVAAVACSPPPSYAIPFHPFPTPGMDIDPVSFAAVQCPPPSGEPYGTGGTSGVTVTGEMNNLTPSRGPDNPIPLVGNPIPACFEGTCWIWYYASD
jgi:hypothetical protein